MRANFIWLLALFEVAFLGYVAEYYCHHEGCCRCITDCDEITPPLLLWLSDWIQIGGFIKAGLKGFETVAPSLR